MRIADHPTITVRYGDSLAGVVHYLRSTPRVWAYEYSRTANEGQQWTFGLSYDDALALALKGWPDGTDRLATGVRAMPAPATTMHKRQHDVGGDYPDVPRYLEGRPDNMVRRGRSTGQKPVVHMVIHPMTNASVTAYEFLTMGTAMALVIDQLEASGRRVELDVAFLRELRPSKWSLDGWKIKSADEHLDFGTLAFSLAHPASSRRLSFALRERTPREQQVDDYGCSRSITPEHLRLIDAENALCINMHYSDCKDTRSAVRSLTQIINLAAGETIVETTYD